MTEPIDYSARVRVDVRYSQFPRFAVYVLVPAANQRYGQTKLFWRCLCERWVSDQMRLPQRAVRKLEAWQFPVEVVEREIDLALLPLRLMTL